MHNTTKPVLRGWLEYYGRYSYPSAMSPVLRHFNQTLMAWAMRKYQTASRAQGASEPLHRGYREATAPYTCALAAWDGWRVCLMGAVGVERLTHRSERGWGCDSPGLLTTKTTTCAQTKGYHVEHNFVHGKKYLAAFLLSLSWLARLPGKHVMLRDSLEASR